LMFATFVGHLSFSFFHGHTPSENRQDSQDFSGFDASTWILKNPVNPV